jgi:hypothetical protein
VRAALCTVASVGWILIGTAPAWAQTVELDWQPPVGCPDAADMSADIAEAAGGPASGRARIRAQREPGGAWTIEVDVGDGARVLRGQSCAEVARAAAVVVGVALRERAEPARQADDVEVPRWTGAEPRWSDAQPLRIERSAPPRPRATQLVASAAVGAVAGVLPETAGMVRAGAALTWRRAAIRVDGGLASARTAMSLESGDEVALRSIFVGATGSGCWIAGRLWLCGGVELGQLRATAAAATDEVAGHGTWAAVRAGPSVAVPVGSTLDLVLEVDGAVPLVYPRFSVNSEPIDDPAPVSVRAGLGLRLRIP